MSVSSPTQRALCLPEILLIIFENVLLSKNDSFAARLGFSPASTLASAALVCKVFTSPALITLWRSIDTLVPLVKLLSVAKVVGLDDEDSESDDWDDLDSDNTVLVLTDDISPEDWKRFTHYAAHVRVLDLGPSEHHHGRNPTIDPSVYGQLFRMNGGRPLLPRLREMSWLQKAASDKRIVYLICPELRRLHIRTRDGSGDPRMTFFHSRHHRDIERRRYKEPRVRDYTLSLVLREVLPAAGNLEHLTLEGFHHLVMLVPVSGCPRLETLDLPSSLANRNVDVPQLISALGSIATLSRLTMPVNQEWELSEDFIHPMPPQFESLETLHLSTKIVEKPQPPALVFATANCPRLQNLTIVVNLEDMGIIASMDLRQILRPPAGFVHMRTLYVRFQGPKGLCDWRSVTLQLSSFLLPLAPLHELEHLYLVCERAWFTCTDNDIRLITRHWPNLSTFAAIFRLPQGEYPSVRSLAYIAHWPRLKVLCLPSLRNLANFDKVLYPHYDLRHFGIISCVEVQDSSEVKNFAVYLSLQFPNLQTAHSFPVRLNDSVDYEWTMCHHWGKILDVVRQAKSVIEQHSHFRQRNRSGNFTLYSCLQSANLQTVPRSL